MATLKPRNRIVVFRLSDEEYDNLQEACQDRGGRNFSDFVRGELLRMTAPQGGQAEGVQRRLSTIVKRLSEIRSSMQRNQELLEQLAKRKS